MPKALNTLLTHINAALQRQPPSEFQRGLWSHVTARTKLQIAVTIALLICSGLALDAAWVKTGQWISNACTFVVFAWLLRLGRAPERWTLLICMALGCFGEIILSLVWRLYDYQFGNLPLFVPPGHALLMLLGVLIAQQLDALFYPINSLKSAYLRASTRHSADFFRALWLMGVPIIALIYGCLAWYFAIDKFGSALCLVFLACMLFGRAKTLYVTMFLLALLMELYGTALENWRWAATVPAAIFSPAHVAEGIVLEVGGDGAGSG